MVFRKASNYFESEDDEVEDLHGVSLVAAPASRTLEDTDAGAHSLGAFGQRSSDALNQLYMSQLPPGKHSRKLM